MYREKKNEDLSDEEKEEQERRYGILKLVMALPLLPVHKIELGWDEIKCEIAKMELTEIFKKFITYFENYWLKTRPPNTWSVFDSPHRTNNVSESYNSTLRAVLGVRSTPLIWIRKNFCVHIDSKATFYDQSVTFIFE